MKRQVVSAAMSQSSESIQKLLLAHFGSDEAGFRTAAWEIVHEERRLNHNVFANELEKILGKVGGQLPSKKFLAALSANNGNMPKDSDRNANLIELSHPDSDLDDLILLPELRADIDRIICERRSSEVLRSHGLKPASKLLFCGPPGCGKTAAAAALAQALYLPLATVRFDAVVSSYLGETAGNLRKVFDYARVRPVLLFFDEFDAIGKERTAVDEHGELKRVVNSFLQMLDSFHSETLTLAATNHQGMLDPALWRRFDDILYFDLPTDTEIELLLSKLFRQVKLAPTIRVKALAKQLVGFAHADIERIAKEAIKAVVLNNLAQVTATIIQVAVARQEKRRSITNNQRMRTPTKQGPPKKN
ncbi:MAG: AAA family ATPase [Pirellulales bacterium]